METTTQTLPQLAGVVANLSIDNASTAIDFYVKTFAAEVGRREAAPDGKLMHAHLRINNGDLFINDFFPEYGAPPVAPQAFLLHLQVTDVDTWWNRAVAAGCTIVMPLEKQFWGDRYGQVKDPYGVTWSLGSSEQ